MNIYVVYRESDACNLAAFVTYSLAFAFTLRMKRKEPSEEFYIDEIELRNTED